MKKIVVVSDTHGNHSALLELRGVFAENDYIFHLGDGANDMRSVRCEYPDKVYQCVGNCDLLSIIPEEGVVEIEGLRIFYCHGHRYRVKQELFQLAQRAKEQDCDIALFGHTHTPLIEKIEGVTLINPGTLMRKLNAGGSYCYLILHNKKATPTIVGEGLR